MAIAKLLIANRGEIAIRIAAAAADLGIATLAVHSADDAQSLHCFKADACALLPGSGAAAYLDIAQMIAIAQANGCDAVHPGYGFLSENADFARACAAAGIVFVGPSADALDLFANKANARALAERSGVPVMPGSIGGVTLAEVEAFFHGPGAGAAVMIKAVAGGGGRGMRIVSATEDIAQAYAACQAEARLAFGDDALFVERFMPRARHIEVQIVADGQGGVMHLGERECSLQRRNQKIIEIAPCPDLSPVLRSKITAAAIRLASAAAYRNIGTFEFLVDAEAMRDQPDEADFYFLEANPRVQVEHTITEEVMDVDLVQTQLRIAAGASLEELGLDRTASPRGFALQARINMEVMTAEGETRPSLGVIGGYALPSGRGVRVDGYGYAGYATNPRYDSLLAKLIVHVPGEDVAALLAKARRALGECRITGVETNIAFLQALLARPELVAGGAYTRFVDDHLPALVAAAGELPQTRHAPDAEAAVTPAGAVIDIDLSPGSVLVEAPMQGLIVGLEVAPGDRVTRGQTLATMEAMKMVHAITAPRAGIVAQIGVTIGQIVMADVPLLVIEADENDSGDMAADETAIDPDHIRPDLAELNARRALGQDDARPDSVARRRRTGQRTARENIDDLCDADSFVEYGALAIASQKKRRTLDDLIRNTPADGIVTGIGSVNGADFGEAASQCAVLSYDYTVMAGTQGHHTHRKKDRLFDLAERQRLPVILFSEGGGGRPGDIDIVAVTGLEVPSFQILARLSGLVPLIGINSGRCFAGNAALLGCCDVIIATENSTIGMGGPAMIEGGGLGVYAPDEVGPMSVQVPNGVVDIAVKDEAEAVAVARQYLSYFQGTKTQWEAPDQRILRRLIPEDRVRAYDVRSVIAGLADTGSVLEIRKGYGQGILTAFARIEGRPIGIIANNPLHLGGAIDAPAADKASRFMQLCDAHDIPLLSLCDTPGFMVGPESEKTATVRRFARLFVTAAGMTIPVMAIVLRKAYGLGAMAMLAGQSKVPDFTVSWPNGEFGGMGLEGAIKLGLRKELEAIEDLDEREAFYRKQVAAAYAFGKAANAAAHFEIDDVIDPADSRRWIMSMLRARPPAGPRGAKKRSHIDTW